jgi:hypothetical protein
MLIKISLESFHDALIQEKDKFIQIRLISIVDTLKKYLVAQWKDKSNNPKKKNHHHDNK